MVLATNASKENRGKIYALKVSATVRRIFLPLELFTCNKGTHTHTHNLRFCAVHSVLNTYNIRIATFVMVTYTNKSHKRKTTFVFTIYIQ